MAQVTTDHNICAMSASINFARDTQASIFFADENVYTLPDGKKLRSPIMPEPGAAPKKPKTIAFEPEKQGDDIVLTDEHGTPLRPLC